MITHTYFIIWDLLSELHRTYVPQSFPAGILLCNSGASIAYFLQTPITPKNSLEFMF